MSAELNLLRHHFDGVQCPLIILKLFNMVVPNSLECLGLVQLNQSRLSFKPRYPTAFAGNARAS